MSETGDSAPLLDSRVVPAKTVLESIKGCDAAELLEGVAAAARTHLPPNLRLEVAEANGRGSGSRPASGSAAG